MGRRQARIRRVAHARDELVEVRCTKCPARLAVPRDSANLIPSGKLLCADCKLDRNENVPMTLVEAAS